MNPIKIDLRDLTQAHIDEALPNIGQCRYASPCIIGTLVPMDKRDALDNEDDQLRTPDDYTMENYPLVGELVAQDIIGFPDREQAALAAQLQMAFDNNGIDGFRRAVDKVNESLGLDLKVPA